MKWIICAISFLAKIFRRPGAKSPLKADVPKDNYPMF